MILDLVEDNWESPTLGSLGALVWGGSGFDGMEVNPNFTLLFSRLEESLVSPCSWWRLPLIGPRRRTWANGIFFARKV